MIPTLSHEVIPQGARQDAGCRRDRQNARIREEFAAHQAEEYAEAERLALAALGPGWTPCMKLVLLDSDYHRSDKTEPVAIACKVYHGEKRLSENAVYIRRLPDGSIRTSPSYEPLFGELLHEPHSTRTIEVRGQRVPCPRYAVCWSALECYEPLSADGPAHQPRTQ